MEASEKFFIGEEQSIRTAMEKMNDLGEGIVLVVDDDNELTDTITDGDVRRALLDEVNLEEPLTEIIAHKKERGRGKPVTAPVGSPVPELLDTMKTRGIRHIPLVNEEGRVESIAVLDQLSETTKSLDCVAVVMVGGYGTRLEPITEETPKVMLPVDGKPLLERTIQRLRESGIDEIYLLTHYMHETIEDHFGDGSEFGVSITYVREDEPLGTAGGLGLIEPPDKPLLVMNGDVLTQVDFPSFLVFHETHDATMTVGVRGHDIQVPYGVIRSEGVRVERMKEKPEINLLVNAGIYLLEPGVLEWIPMNERLDMPEVMRDLLEDGEKVVSFPIHEYWLDIGRPEDYKKAQKDVDADRYGAISEETSL